MAQAQANTGNVVDFFEAAIERVKAAATNVKAAREQLEKAINDVIPLAINKAIANKNCNPIDKINAALRGVDVKTADAFRKNFIAYCHSPSGLNMPKETVMYADALNRFLCNINALAAWKEANPNLLETAKTLSQWLDTKKTNEKPVKDGKAEAKKALAKAVKTIESYGLHFDNDAWLQIRARINTFIENN